MPFRDDTEALRARIDSLEAELSAAQDRIEEREADHEELGPLRARVQELEAELGKSKTPRVPVDWGRFAKPAIIAGVVGVAGVVALLSADVIGGPDDEAAPTRGMVELAQHPFPPSLGAEVQGTHSLSDLGCQGAVPTEPLLVLRATAQTRVRLWTTSSDDLVLFVRTQSGEIFCDDDSGDRMNPMLVADLPAGDHRVWVGTYETGERGSFELHIDAREPADSGVATDAAPTIARVTLDGPVTHPVSGQTEGRVRAAQTNGCLGFVPVAPQVALDVQVPGTATLNASGPQDLVLVLRRPDGSFVCDDDSGSNTDPRLDVGLAVGAHDLWVGTYAEGNTSAFDLRVDFTSAPAPDPDPAAPPHSAPPRLGRWDLASDALLSFTDRVDGDTPVSSTHPECRMLYGSATADVELTLGEPLTVTLSLTSDSWLGLLVEHPDGTQSCDPSLGNTPQPWSAGSHRVWVAAPEPGAHVRYTLVTQTRDP